MKIELTHILERKAVVLTALIIISVGIHFNSTSISRYAIGATYTFVVLLLAYFTLQKPASLTRTFSIYSGIALLLVQFLFVFSLNDTHTRDRHFVRNIFTGECREKDASELHWYDKPDIGCRPSAWTQ